MAWQWEVSILGHTRGRSWVGIYRGGASAVPSEGKTDGYKSRDPPNNDGEEDRGEESGRGDRSGKAGDAKTKDGGSKKACSGEVKGVTYVYEVRQID